MDDNKKERNHFSGLTLEKYYSTEDDDIDTRKLQVQHPSGDYTSDILITGIQNEHGKWYT